MILYDESTLIDAAGLADWIGGDVDEVDSLAAAGVLQQQSDGRFRLVESIKAAVVFWGGPDAWENIPLVDLGDLDSEGSA